MLPPPYHGSFTLLSTPAAPSSLHFRGCRHGDRVDFDDAIEMPPPTDGYAEPPRESIWSTSREYLADSATVFTDGA